MENTGSLSCQSPNITKKMPSSLKERVPKLFKRYIVDKKIPEGEALKLFRKLSLWYRCHWTCDISFCA
uniref:Uncharacterized protein n=1 Tax=Arundo donax TaxID=35708 RepID=A0A0A9D4Z7_ARUDO